MGNAPDFACANDREQTRSAVTVCTVLRIDIDGKEPRTASASPGSHLRLKLKLEKQHTRMMLRLLCIAAVAPALAFVSRPAARPLSRPVAARVCRQETVRCAAIPLGKQSDEDYVSSIPIDSPPVDATKELPKVNGAIIAGTRKLCVITGASSGLGKEAARALCESGDYFVIMACRDVEKAKRVAEEEGFPANSYTVMKLELGSLASVRNFVFNLKVGRGARTPSARAERREPSSRRPHPPAGRGRLRRAPLAAERPPCPRRRSRRRVPSIGWCATPRSTCRPTRSRGSRTTALRCRYRRHGSTSVAA